MKRRAAAVMVVAAIGLGMWGVSIWRGRPPAPAGPSVDALLDQARNWLGRRRFAEAEQAVRQALAREPDHPQGLLVLGEIAMRQGDLPQAEECMRSIPRSSPEAYGLAQFSLGEMARTSGRLSAAEAAYRESLAVRPDFVPGQRGLSFVLNISGRRWEAVRPMLRELELGSAEINTLTQIGYLEQLVYNPEYIAQCRAAAPDDPLPQLSAACVAMRERRWDEARTLLTAVTAAHPELVEAHSRLGQVLYEVGAEQDFLRWHAALPAAADEHPDIWVLRGSWRRSRQQMPEAMRCYWEAVRRDPDHRVAVYQLAQLCQTQGRAESAVLLPRAEKLQTLADRLSEIRLAPSDWPRIAQAAELTGQLGRWWEARGWAEAARQSGVNDAWVAATLESAARRLATASAESRDVELDPAIAKLDFSDCPLPQWPPTGTGSEADAPVAATSPIRFEDVAASGGIAFQFYNDADPSTDGMRMLESFGGGVGAIDFDRDGWCDLYLTQGAAFPPRSDRPVYLDGLFRNRAGARWAECAAAARVVEERFSTGVSVGDFDGDGFPDVYVGNIGVNRLWRNNGDGTFTDATTEAGLKSEVWTTSCCLADLDGDGLADLYDVNYLGGDAVYTRICQDQGVSRACMPSVFSAAPDEAWRSLGDGRFESAASAWKLDVAVQDGLGIVAADFDESGDLDLFVANDAVPNSYYANLASNRRNGEATTDAAVLAGLAFDRDGKAQACMGVAAGDADRDGRLDLFVTNYYDESNTLYRQELPGLFTDDAAAFRLREPSFRLLGFGTQFLDADLDGREDLVLVNGHVDDFSYEGTPYRMRPQFFRQREGGFDELSADSLGEWFTREQLGRGLARLDWNRDGRPDFAVSHLDTPAALLTNRTSDAAMTVHSLTLRLVGVTAHRDAVGAIVRVEAGEQRQMRQVTAGDGYQASNERSLTFGLGAAEEITRLEIAWPGGRRETHSNLRGDAEYVVIEGASPLRVR